MGDWTTFYGWNARLEQFEPPESYEIVIERLPDVLMLNWRFAMSYETNPGWKVSMMTKIRSECWVVTVGEEMPS